MQNQTQHIQNKRGIMAVFANADGQIVAEIRDNFQRFTADHTAQVSALSDRLVSLEQNKIVMPGFAGNSRASFGATVASEFAKHRDALRSNGRVSFDVSAAIVGSEVGATSSPTTPITPSLQPGWLSDYLPRIPADGAFTVNYLRVTGVSGSAGVQVGEGSAKSQSQPTLVRVAQNAITVAGWCTVSEQALGSEVSLRQTLDTHLQREVGLALDTVLVDGNSASGTDWPFDGFEPLATSFAATFSDVRDAIVQCAISMRIAGFVADVLVIHPTDFANILLARDLQERYQGVLDLFPGLKVALSSNVTLGSPLVAASGFMALHVGSQMNVQFALVNDDFIKNQVTVRGELAVAPAMSDVRALRQVVPAVGSPA